MKRTIQAVLVASFLSLPLLAHVGMANAQTTRAQVRAELVAAEQAGQYPQSDAHYPDAAADVALTHVADRAAIKASNQESYGTSSAGSFAAGLRHLRVHVVSDSQSVDERGN
ncbi:DUF4148 domain-containing protein [Paraburkholderia fungorum]|uniref:DUF4148 domain-containing protein n=1 Tax=Paraburkholderia fungorum TaxID=134537 RepID=UPI0038B76D4E